MMSLLDCWVLLTLWYTTCFERWNCWAERLFLCTLLNSWWILPFRLHLMSAAFITIVQVHYQWWACYAGCGYVVLLRIPKPKPSPSPRIFSRIRPKPSAYEILRTVTTLHVTQVVEMRYQCYCWLSVVLLSVSWRMWVCVVCTVCRGLWLRSSVMGVFWSTWHSLLGVRWRRSQTVTERSVCHCGVPHHS